MTRHLDAIRVRIRLLGIVLLFAPLLAQGQETVSTPSVPSGPTSGLTGTLYMYSASGSTSSLGNAVHYSFNWGDGTSSGWTPNGVTFSFHTWSTPGTYTVTVQACSAVNPSVLSSVSPGLTVTIAGESITTPTTPTGPTTAVTGTASSYSTAGAVSSLGHPVQYMLFWGDGSNSPWLAVGTTSASHSWPGPGTYTVTAQARCSIDTQVLSAISAGRSVVVTAGETISTPAAPSGPTAVTVGTSYTYSTGGASVSSGNAVSYLFNWGDGQTSGWLAAGTTSSSHSWTASGSYNVTTLAADATALLIQSSASSGLTVTVSMLSVTFAGTVGSMQSARSGQTATRLASGQILVAGGKNSSGVLGSSELYNPSNQTFTASGTMATQRWMQSATRLNDGTVLIAGGSNSLAGTTLNTAEIYAPSTGTFSLLPNTLNTARAGHTATLLNNGQVLLVGGIDPTAGILSDAELYDPPTQTFIDLGDTNDPRYRHAATLLQNGQVLIAGGETDPAPLGAFNSAELFDPVAQTFTALLVPMTSGREGHAAILLNNGQVLIAGGDNDGTTSVNTAELFNPTLAIFTPVTAPMAAARFSPTATLLNGGTVLIAGGATDAGGSSTVLSSGEVFNPSTQTFASVGGMTSAREYQTASLLNDGTVLFAGGTSGTAILNSAELYMASQLSGLVSIAVTPATSSIGAGAQQSFTATGTFSNGSVQQLASVLWSSSSTSVAPVSGDSTNSGTAQTTAQGTATVTASAPGVSGTATLTVMEPTLVSFAVSPQNTAIPLATTQQFAATGTYTDGSTQDLTASAAWTSTATAVAPIANSGLATGLALGSATIQAAYGTWSASTGATVVGPALVSFSITPGTATIAFGTSLQYHATGMFSDSSTQDVTALVSWSSGTTTVASVTAAGLATAVAQGTSTITAASGSVTVSGSLTVGPPTLAAIAITPNVVVLSTTGTQQLTATGTYTDGSKQSLTASVTWTSSNTAVATVNSGGLATAVTAGTAIVTATSGSISVTASLVISTGTTQTNLVTSRYQHSATVLNSGNILLTGGVTCPTAGSCSYLSSAEIYNSATDTFASTGAMATTRSAPAVLLNSGKVLVAGGYTCNSSGACTSLNSAEIYDPVAATFSGAGTMTASRSGQTMTLLNNGTVLIAGGETCTSATSCTAQSSAEIYNPVAGTFATTANNMSAARFGASAVALGSGLVLIAGGFDGANLPAAAELFDPVAGLFEGIGASLNVPRFAATATLLNDGQVLVAGGSSCASGCPTNAAEIYDPLANTFSVVTGGMTSARFDHTATLVNNGQVYIAGGFSSCSSSCTSVASTDIFDPVAVTFTGGPVLNTALAGQTATLVASGDVLLTGGINAGVTVTGDTWYQPASLTPPGLLSIAVTPASLELVLGQPQQFVATGTFNDGSTQTLQSVLWSSSNSSVATVSNAPGSAGTVTAFSAGATKLTATAGNVSGSASLRVATLVTLSISPTLAMVGVPQQFTASGTLSDGSVLNLTALATWSSGSPNSLTFEGNPGTALGTTSGSFNVTATVGTVSQTVSVVVQSAPPPPAPSITGVTPSSGVPGTVVTISGTGFGATQGTGSVTLGSTVGTVITWSSTQIQAVVASNAVTGSVTVQESGVSSNSILFTVNRATISGVSPSTAAPGKQITIAGTYFGTTQGQVFIGNASSTVVSWSPTQVVAVVPSQAKPGPGNVQMLQSNVMSSPWAFTVDSLYVTGISPNSGGVGTSVTFSGYGFGATQGSSTVSIGNAAANVTSWSDTAVVATVGAGAMSGPAFIVQDGVPSNGKHFQMSSGITLAPDIISMVVGQSGPIQALNASSQPVTGFTWTSSNPNIVSLSSADPPTLTALAVGRVTITAGTGSAVVTVSAAGSLPVGTVLWSNPGDGSGVERIVPAVPSSSRVADVFAFQNDGTVAAITSEGTTAWTANLGASGVAYWDPGSTVPDFQGGLILVGSTSGNAQIWKLDGMTGQALPKYTTGSFEAPPIVVHPDGTILTLDAGGVVGIDSLSGVAKFSVPIPVSRIEDTYPPIIAGDGYAYFPYSYVANDDTANNGYIPFVRQVSVLRVNSSGAFDNIDVAQFVGGTGDILDMGVNAITNADQGVLLTWWTPSSWPWPPTSTPVPSSTHMATITGTAVAVVNAPQVPDGYGNTLAVTPVLQAQDGSFVGRTFSDMVAFDSSGNVRWVVPNMCPQIATADGGVIAQAPNDGDCVSPLSGAGYTFDGNGNATGMRGSMPVYSWQGYSYQVGSVEQELDPPLDFALTDAAFDQNGRGPVVPGTASKLVQVKIFAPFPKQIWGTDAAPDLKIVNQWLTALSQNATPDHFVVEVLTDGQVTKGRATSSAYLDSLQVSNRVVAYLDHGVERYDNKLTYTLCFTDSKCIVPTPLTMVKIPYEAQLSSPQIGFEFVQLPEGFSPKSKVVILAACAITDFFTNYWHLGADEALIVPKYNDLNTSLNLLQGFAAWEISSMISILGNGKDYTDSDSASTAVTTAVNQANTTKGDDHTWRLIGNPNVTFNPQKH